MPAPGWWLGSRGTRDVGGPNPAMGGFNLGGVQTPFSAPSSSVASPDAGVSGTPAGQPPEQSADSAAGGSGPNMSPGGPGFSVGEAASVAGRGGVFGTGLPSFGSVTGTGTAGNMAAGMAGVPDVSSVPGVISGLGRLVGAALGPAMTPFSLTNAISSLAANNMTDPATAMTAKMGEPSVMSGNPASDPNDLAVGLPTTMVGRAISAINAANEGASFDTSLDASGNPGMGPGSPFGGFSGASLGNPGAAAPGGIGYNFSLPGAVGGTNRDADPDGPSGVTGPVGVPGEGMTNDGPSIDTGGGAAGGGGGVGGGSGAGAGGAAGAGGDGSGPGGDGQKRGGRIGGRPDPRKLSAKLKAGATVQQGSKKPGADDVPVRLSRGEEVVNKKATDAFGPILDQMNKLGNRAGGMSVGRRTA